MSKRLKIAFFIDVYYPMIDGVIVVVDNYAKRLAEFADVTVFCPKPLEKTYDDSKYNYIVKRCKRFTVRHYDYPIATPCFDRKFRKYLKEQDFDIIHIHSPFFVARLGIKYAKKHKIPIVATLHSQYKRDFMVATKSKLFTKILLKYTMRPFAKCTECWAVNESVKNIFVDDYGLKSPCRVLNNGTDLLTVDSTLATNTINAEYGISPNQKVLLFTGRINLIKNLKFIIDALVVIKQAGIDYKMIFCGSGQDEKVLKNYAVEKGVMEDVIFTGRVADREKLKMLYSRADLFLFPSLYDSSSLVQIEAASQHTPTAFIRGSATSATATEDVDCIMSDDDSTDFANKIIRALTDDEFYQKIKEGAYNNLYVTWDVQVKKAYERYLELIEENQNNK